LWNFFAEATTTGMYSIVSRGDLLRKIHFPSYIVTASATIGSLISLGINLVVVLVFSIFGGVHFTWRVFLVPFNLLQLYILAFGFAMLLATLNVYFRDIGHIWEVLLQALFYAVPVIYPLSMVTAISPVFAKIMLLNPMAQTIQDIRHNLIAPETTPTMWNMIGNPWVESVPMVLTALILGLGIWLFRKNSHKFAEVL
jgi:ABC-2 type transport system permease protein